MDELPLGKPEKSVLLWREIWTNIGFFFFFLLKRLTWMQAKNNQPCDTNSIAWNVSMFQQDSWSRAWQYNMSERERGWTCFAEAIIHVQQVIVTNESDILDQVEKTL